MAESDHGQIPEYECGSVPAWVKDIPYSTDHKMTEEDFSRGVYCLLLDCQIDLMKGESCYYHRVSYVTNQKGAEYIGHFNVTFNPAFERVTLHRIRVIRASESFDQLHPDRISVLNCEQNLDCQILSGAKMLSLVLQDIRPGDIVETGFSINGQNPVLKGHVFNTFILQWGEPVYRSYCRLRYPQGREIFFGNYNVTVQRQRESTPDVIELTWNREQIPALLLEDQSPSWYDPSPRVEFSDFKSWKELADLLAELYRVPSDLSPELQEVIQRIKKESHSKSEIVMNAVRFVQDEIRYFAMGIGKWALVPHDPSLVLTRRFGDCKDKALLAITILNALGIRAWPVLVNSVTRKTISDEPPSLAYFNHAIIEVAINGQRVRLDTTASMQRGGLDDQPQPCYGAQLILNPEETPLVNHEPKPLDKPTLSVAAELDARGGPSQPAWYRVTSVLLGERANNFRNHVATYSRAEIQKSCQDYLAVYYPKIQRQGELEIKDDHIFSNQFTLTEKYQIPDVWEYKTAENADQLVVCPVDILDLIVLPKSWQRSSPLAIAFPVYIEYEIVVKLPQSSWQITNEECKIASPFFHFSLSSKFSDNCSCVKYIYKSLVDHIGVEKLPEYEKDLKKAREMSSFIFTMPRTAHVQKKPEDIEMAFYLWGTVITVLGLLLYLFIKMMTRS